MAITRIIVVDFIMAGNLFQEQGYDLDQSADNLAELKGQIIVNYLEEKYPGVEIYADIAIQKEARNSLAFRSHGVRRRGGDRSIRIGRYPAATHATSCRRNSRLVLGGASGLISHLGWERIFFRTMNNASGWKVRGEHLIKSQNRFWW